MYIFDTDILTILDLRQGNEYDALVRHIREHPQSDFGTTIITFEEQMRGWLAYIAKSRDTRSQVAAYDRLSRMLMEFSRRHVLAFDDTAVSAFNRLRRLKLKVGTMDLKIAAIAIANQSILITRNLKDFRGIPGLQAEDWTV